MKLINNRKMKAIGFETENGKLKVLKIKIPDLENENEVQIKMIYSGICGSDLNFENINWENQKLIYPHIGGHEGIGKVIKIGKKVNRVKINDLVAFETHIFCNKCYQCQKNNRNLCDNLKILGLTKKGVWSQYIVLPERILFPLTNIDVPISILTILEPLGNVFHLLSYSKLENKKIAVIGDGPIGLLTSLIINDLKNTEVFLFGKNKLRKKIAEKWNLNYVDVQEKKSIKKNDFDLVFEVSGSEMGLKSGLDYVSKNGQINVLSLYKKENIFLNINKLIYKNINLQFVFGRKIWSTWIQTINFLLINKELVKKMEILITDKIYFEDFEIGFKKLKQGKSGKVVLFFDQ